MECACLMTVCISRFKRLGSYESALRILMANGVFVVLSLLHTYVSRWNLRRLLRSVEWIDPKKYSPARLTRILCVADIRKDQCKFPRNFPEVVLQTYPGNPSVIVFSILFKLYDPSAHKELLEFAENLSMFYSTNKYLSSMLRSIIFIASGTTTTKGTSISSSLLSICYKLEEQYWYYVIQNNTKTAQMAFHDLTQLVQRAKPFFERHNAVIGGNEDFSKYITLRPENYEDKIMADSLEEEDKSDNPVNSIPLIENHDEYFQLRLKSIKKVNPSNFVFTKSLGVIILTIIVLGCILGYLFGSASGIPPLRMYKMVQRMFLAYSNIVSAWYVPISLYLNDAKSDDQKKLGLETINTSFDNIFTISYLKNTKNISELFLKAQEELIQATENETFVSNSNTTDKLFMLLMNRCKYLYTTFNTYGTNADKMAKITLYGLTFVLAIFLVLFYLLMYRSQKLYFYLGCQTMHFKKNYVSFLRKKYQKMILKETKTLPESGKFNNSYLTFCVACLFPLIIGYIYALDIKMINKQFINFIKVSLLTSQATPMIANNNILIPLLMNDLQINESLSNIKLSYCFLMGLNNNIYTTNLSFEYESFFNQTSYDSIIKSDSESHETLIRAMKNVNKQIFVEMMNISLVLVRDFYIILMESGLNQSVRDVARLTIPLIIYSKNPLINFLTDVNKKLNFLADSVYFTFISAPILFFIAIFVMIVYGMVIISRINTSVDLMQRMICLPKYDNPFFDENHNFLGYKDQVKKITNEIFNSFPIPTFQVSKEMKVVDQNQAAEAIFGDIKGTLMHNIPMEITDCYGTRNYYNYSTYLRKNLPSNLELKGEKVVISNDMTGLFNKKETLRNLYKDIRLTFSIPNVLQRDKATHIQNVAIVNFLFSSNVTNDQFLSYSSKIEDFFSQFVSFFMFEKMRFSFYVLFYDPNSSRQTCRDALAFAQIARYEGVNRKIEVKIAVTMEDELIAMAQKNDMIWSVKFPNSILWRSDMMHANIDYGRIICLSKMSPGMHFSKTLSLGVHHEQIEVTTL
ncbi:hypothetical protein TVAG_487520 [Trichomonas vaginalis G3]|uniref:PAS domain-containing protein n=1 Tax=Trichomonas vaginalis (strain ATCC PRA-98 / G3) TaxID=412133 RepID=A2EFN1_TRIV3|nr:hypothetical protein TVAGG3_0062090 [Trichomonas vaginalis G3]EAY08526.1 hypothetical protein TVAG_487520 [Trichomonas vaginalis G3]KAI5542087.1 hypothetical protein TVAGG3_0062090 [Trichomonas vaginalis G3]|eukprot:XP_001320749.1 hypothetical protein [Trichomonas vaginalis G3]